MNYDEYMRIVQENVVFWLEKGVNPWQEPWITVKNGETKRAYSGNNAVLLTMISNRRYDGDPRFYTFDQANKLGYKIKKGEHGYPAYFFQTSSYRVKKDEDGNPVLDENGKKVREQVRIKPVFMVYTVFNAKQLENVPDYVPSEYPEEEFDEKTANRFVENSPASIHHDQFNRAFYASSNDSIHLPPQKRFETLAGYYSTLFHEMTHSTGIPSRLNRESLNNYRFERPREELIAELGAVMLSSAVGLKYENRNSAAYIRSWADMISSGEIDFKSLYGDVSKAVHFLKYPNDREKIREESLKNNADTAEVRDIETSNESLIDDSERLLDVECDNGKIYSDSGLSGVFLVSDKGDSKEYLRLFSPHNDATIVFYSFKENKDGLITDFSAFDDQVISGSLRTILRDFGYNYDEYVSIDKDIFLEKYKSYIHSPKDADPKNIDEKALVADSGLLFHIQSSDTGIKWTLYSYDNKSGEILRDIDGGIAEGITSTSDFLSSESFAEICKQKKVEKNNLAEITQTDFQDQMDSYQSREAEKYSSLNALFKESNEIDMKLSLVRNKEEREYLAYCQEQNSKNIQATYYGNEKVPVLSPDEFKKLKNAQAKIEEIQHAAEQKINTASPENKDYLKYILSYTKEAKEKLQEGKDVLPPMSQSEFCKKKHGNHDKHASKARR